MENANIKIFAPVTGTVVPLGQIPDPAFSQAMLGDGIGIKPENGAVAAPFDGIVTMVHKNLHAVTLSSGGTEVLIHIGVETINLKGKGFEAFVKEGSAVKKGDRLIKFDPAFVAANADSDIVVVIVTNPLKSDLFKTKETRVSAGESFLMSCGGAPAEEEISGGEEVVSDPVQIKNPHGLHARPAGLLANAASKYKAKVEIEKGGVRANAKSIVAIMGLGIEKGDKIIIRAAGDGAENAVKDILSEIAKGLGEEAGFSRSANAAAQETAFDFSSEFKARGVSASPGFVIGKTVVIREEKPVLPTANKGVDSELKDLENALARVKENIEDTILIFKDRKVYKEILSAHISILEDPFLVDTAKTFIRNGENAAAAFSGAAEKSVAILSGGANALIKERIADYKDINRKVIMVLTGEKPKHTVFKKDSVLVIKELLPNDVLTLDANVAGVLCAEGSATSHASIMLKNAGIPVIVGLGGNLAQCRDGIDVIMDAAEGAVVFNPSAKLLAETKNNLERAAKIHAENKAKAFEPAVTGDGAVITVEGNIGSAQEAKNAYENGAEGIGLVRTEFLFRNTPESPSEEEQYQAYKEVCKMINKPVTFRTFDVGGDKPLPFINIPNEENPIVGLRGVRNYGMNGELIKNQIRALVRISAEFDILVMVPMVSFVEEFAAVKKMFEGERKNLGVKKTIPLGITVEVPSVAVMAEEFIKEADFFSIGTNDLTQYTLAIDRGHSILAAQAGGLNPAVLKLIELTASAAAARGKIAAVCGGMASELHCAPVLLGLGVRSLAVSCAAMADIKALIRTLEMKKCQAVARAALGLQSAAQVRELIRKEFGL